MTFVTHYERAALTMCKTVQAVRVGKRKKQRGKQEKDTQIIMDILVGEGQ